MQYSIKISSGFYKEVEISLQIYNNFEYNNIIDIST